ncbi:hypothetical protein QBC46DRAFT_427973, partial [Diplogelasinospora grovesii]
VLPCGHVFGSGCWERYERDRMRGPGRVIICPLAGCGFELGYKRCPHRVEPRAPRVDLKNLPLTIPEGGKVPDTCLCCRLAQGK